MIEWICICSSKCDEVGVRVGDCIPGKPEFGVDVT